VVLAGVAEERQVRLVAVEHVGDDLLLGQADEVVPLAAGLGEHLDLVVDVLPGGHRSATDPWDRDLDGGRLVVEVAVLAHVDDERVPVDPERGVGGRREDRKSTRLNSSHVKISYAVFCLKKKKKT